MLGGRIGTLSFDHKRVGHRIPLHAPKIRNPKAQLPIRGFILLGSVQPAQVPKEVQSYHRMLRT